MVKVKVQNSSGRYVNPYRFGMTRGKRADLFWRAAMSGGRATVQGKRGIKNKTQAGDISSVSSEGMWLIDNFVVECKHYKDLQLDVSLLKHTGVLYKFWVVLKAIADNAGKYPLLIAKQNNMPALLITTWEGTRLLGFETTKFKAYEWPADFHLWDDLLTKVKSPLKIKRVKLDD